MDAWDPITAADARRGIEEEIEEHSRVILKLRHRLNSLVPIARLPPEVLADIFVHMACDEYMYLQNLTSLPRSRPLYQWLKVAHICHRWREIALGTPRLWGFIYVLRPRALEELRARSRNAPLYINATLPSIGSSETQKILRDIITQDHLRLRDLRLCASAQLICDLWEKLGGPAPFLEGLVLSAVNNGSRIVPPVLPHSLSQEHIPRLDYLSISRLVVGWDSPLFCSTVTFLDFSGARDGRTRLGTFEDFLRALENMSALRRLYLEDAVLGLPSDTSSLPPPSRKVSLSQLSELRVIDENIDCANALNHFITPATCEYLVRGEGHTGSQPLLSLMRDRLHSCAPLRTMLLSGYHSERVDITTFRDVVDIVNVKELSSWAVRLEMQLSRTDLSSLVRDFKIFRNIHTLEIKGTIPGLKWKHLLYATPQLRVLVVDRDDDKGEVFKVLASMHGKKKGRPSSMVVPRLEVLKLEGLRFSEFLYDDDDAAAAATPPQPWELLIDCLMKRRQFKSPLKALHLVNVYNIVREDVDRLKEIVPTVQWDGIEQFDDEFDDDEEDMWDEETDPDDMFDDDEEDLWL